MSFGEEIRRAVMASPRVKLPEIRSAMYKAFAAGQLTEAEAETLDTLINARAAIPSTEAPARRRVGSRPRSSASMERRRSWAAAGRLPPALAAQFTLAEQAVLAVVASEVKKNGVCSLTIGHIAALAGVSETTVRNALRQAQTLALVTIEERRRTAWMNYPNKVSVVSKEWSLWLRLSTGANSRTPRIQKSKSSLALTPKNTNPGSLAAAGNRFWKREHPADPEDGLSA
ncbi:GntR family transcriptional regulator [Vibrio parahaemolyticus]|uniref:GntR family transcriptional regulator n=1 Tax=Microvirga mediterraneensis TaxID=2754695 RepID=A0A838BVG5_9HYPH|nr:GntR family transcriptional regulator [Microvirga mediterraneensis]MBA1159421.1 GntR family transcriptional regulator [Microvirga mediterraneensis]MDG2570471.1 GntR family transcriptional regulator [Vibrio parahaemolyticus]